MGKLAAIAVLLAMACTSATPEPSPSVAQQPKPEPPAPEASPAAPEGPRPIADKDGFAPPSRPDVFARRSSAAPMQVRVTNVGGRPCTYALHAGDGMPAADAPSAQLDPRAMLTLEMYEDEQLCLRNDEKDRYGSSASVDKSGGEIVLYAGCGAIAAADLGFTPKQRARMAPHGLDFCCKTCTKVECSGCNELEKGATCAEATSPAKCTLVRDVFDCVPASEVDEGGTPKSTIMSAG